jgi:excisionase family DNA binding protein
VSHGDRSSGRPISPGDAAGRLGVSTRTVQRWLREGRLPAIRVGERLKVDPSAFSGDSVGALSRSLPSDTSEHTEGPSGGAARAIRRLLVANRGELPVRIARTCRRLGIVSIALVPPDQEPAWWATQLDERQPLIGSYLDGAAILDAARAAGADAIHPGYGFLAENADFAESVTASGLTWVGPPAAAMRALGDKAAGRQLAASVGVPTLPGYDGTDQQDETLQREADRVGYPLLIKPSAGGGGKGMHVAADATELAPLLPQARREALAAFGDERLILERYVPRPRHVEVQLLLDGFGNGVHLGERDCSLQRRHQKVIEEAPSPTVDADLRSRLGDAALRLARAAGYVGAGTAEFLLDSKANFFFLEVNARLQVEHPVTEAITGRDLVEDQLRVAAGQSLGFTQSDVQLRGHAIEARLYAEDPWAGFLPATGHVSGTRWPDLGTPSGATLRVDRGVETGDDIGTRYDPLVAKIICHANDRSTAIASLNDALEQTSVLGVTTNRGFLRTLLSLEPFVDGKATTDLIERTWTLTGEPPIENAWPIAAWVLSRQGNRDAGVAAGFRVNAAPRLRVRIGELERGVSVPQRAPGAMWTLVATADGARVVIDLDGLSVRASVAPAPTVETAISHAQRTDDASTVTAPMPGVVLHVRVHEGDAVETGRVLVILEAMKMENAVAAPSSGTVARVNVRAGDQVSRGDILVELR